MIQCGNKVRLYPSCDPWAATVSPASSLTAVEADGIPGGDGVGSAPLSKGWQTTKSHATPEIPIVMILRDKVKLECEIEREYVELEAAGFILHLIFVSP